ncbi:hypothetical protein L1987_63920 [Smallanthus sonchifolius]|uniref:Uncharacterized protein n=1 Tax=Smallanthus sonchifolius TaxID=185202 RepID=A0ACB9CEI8_9ASTR|nr:hypothetical protein L1987_63920 [Smallanthus sonchifolius]
MNYFVKNDLVFGVPKMKFSVLDDCIPCKKGKQHKKSHKSKTKNSIVTHLELLQMDLFGPISIRSIGGKSYCLVVIDDFSRFSWVKFLGSKAQTTELVQFLILGLENLCKQKVRRIRSDNGSEFKNIKMGLFCLKKGIHHEFNSKLPFTFWVEDVNIACHVLNRVLTVKRHNKTCYELLNNRKPNLEYLLPFGNPCTLLKVRDVPTKFSGKAIEGIFPGYVANSTTKRVYNKETRQSFQLPSDISPEEAAVLYDSCQDAQNSGFLPTAVPQSSVPSTSAPDPNVASCSGTQESDSEDDNVIFQDSSADPLLVDEPSNSTQAQAEIPTNLDSEIPDNRDMSYQYDTTQVDVLPVPEVASIKELKAHPITNIIGNLRDGVQTRSIIDNTCLYTCIKDTGVFDVCSHSFFISQVEPKNVEMALRDNNWIEAMQEELAQFDKLKVWNLVDLPKGVHPIGTKWVFKCKKDDLGVVVRNKERLVVQGFNQHEGIDYTEVYAPVARIEAIRLFLAFASYKGFKVFQLDIKSAFLYGKVKEEFYVCQQSGFEDPINPSKVFKLDKALYGLHQAPRAWYETMSTHLMDNDFVRGQIDSTLFIKKAEGEYLLVQIYVDDIIFGSTNEGLCKEFESVMKSKFEMSAIEELSFFLGLQINQKEDGFFIHQSKYVKDILSRFKMEDCTPYDTPIPVNHKLNSDPDGKEVDCRLYHAMIGSLMYLTTSRPDIMFAVCICSRFKAKPKESHLIAVKRIFRYLKGKQRLGLWFPHGSNLEFNAYTDSDFDGCCLDRKSTTGGFQFLGTTMFIDNNATMSITNNPVKQSKTKHIEIRYHFIRDCVDKKLIELVKVHIDDNFADLFTKTFDRNRKSTTGGFQFLDKKLIELVKLHIDDNFADLFTKTFDRNRFEFMIKMIGMINPE